MKILFFVLILIFVSCSEKGDLNLSQIFVVLKVEPSDFDSVDAIASELSNSLNTKDGVFVRIKEINRTGEKYDEVILRFDEDFRLGESLVDFKDNNNLKNTRILKFEIFGFGAK